MLYNRSMKDQGGATIFDDINRNHHIFIEGMKFIIPLFISYLFTDAYTIT